MSFLITDLQYFAKQKLSSIHLKPILGYLIDNLINLPNKITPMNRTIAFLFILLIPMMMGCKELVVKMADSGTTVHLAVDQILKIELPGNASTGNNWRKIVYTDSVMVKMGKQNYVLSDERDGSAGVYYFRFKGLAPGTGKIYMEYGSKFDSSKEPLKVFELEVVVIGR